MLVPIHYGYVMHCNGFGQKGCCCCARTSTNSFRRNTCAIGAVLCGVSALVRTTYIDWGFIVGKHFCVQYSPQLLSVPVVAVNHTDTGWTLMCCTNLGRKHWDLYCVKIYQRILYLCMYVCMQSSLSNMFCVGANIRSSMYRSLFMIMGHRCSRLTLPLDFVLRQDCRTRM